MGLLATLALGSQSWSDITFIAIVSVVGGVVIWSVLARSARERRERELQLTHHQSLLQQQQDQKVAAELSASREKTAFDQHIETNKIGIEKMRREVELLDLQIKLAGTELITRRDVRDYNDLMMDKTRLEIESLKLHIKEQRKRLDEFGAQDE